VAETMPIQTPVRPASRPPVPAVRTRAVSAPPAAGSPPAAPRGPAFAPAVGPPAAPGPRASRQYGSALDARFATSRSSPTARPAGQSGSTRRSASPNRLHAPPPHDRLRPTRPTMLPGQTLGSQAQAPVRLSRRKAVRAFRVQQLVPHAG